MPEIITPLSLRLSSPILRNIISPILVLNSSFPETSLHLCCKVNLKPLRKKKNHPTMTIERARDALVLMASTLLSRNIIISTLLFDLQILKKT